MHYDNRTASINDPIYPLVSVLIYNYNYGKYLKECLDSVLEQTYPNIEICFSDNSSRDDSWDIALDYQQKYPDIINVACNRINFGAHANVANCSFSKQGKYHVLMCSDDVMAPDFIEKCVSVLEENPQCAYVMVNRAIIDDNSNVTDEPPFYNKSCFIKGGEQAAVYMMAAVNPSVSQVMYVSSRSAVHGADVAKELVGRWYGTRILDFNLCCSYDMAYIKEPLLLHRLHGGNDSQKAAGNLIEIIGPFILNYQFAETGRSYNLLNVSERLPKATDKLSQLCLRYCTRFLIDGKEVIAEQYFHLAVALSLNIKSNKTYEQISMYWKSMENEKANIINELKKESNFITRNISYDPPEGSIEIKDFTYERQIAR